MPASRKRVPPYLRRDVIRQARPRSRNSRNHLRRVSSESVASITFHSGPPGCQSSGRTGSAGSRRSSKSRRMPSGSTRAPSPGFRSPSLRCSGRQNLWSLRRLTNGASQNAHRPMSEISRPAFPNARRVEFERRAPLISAELPSGLGRGGLHFSTLPFPSCRRVASVGVGSGCRCDGRVSASALPAFPREDRVS